MTKSEQRYGTLPSPAALAAYLDDNAAAPGGWRQIARAFRLAPADHAALRDMLRAIAGAGRETSETPQAQAEITTIECFGADQDGVPLARPLVWRGRGDAPIYRVQDGAAALNPGDRAAARLIRRDSGEIEAQVIRRLDPDGNRVVGIFHRQHDGGGRIVPADRRDRNEYRVAARDSGDTADGALVVAETRALRRGGTPQARIVENLGGADDPGAFSRLAIAQFEIPEIFPPDAIAEAVAAQPVDLAERSDLRAVALVTIDGSDARDFDDAVWAEPDPDPANPGGWHLIVAIADVAWYVRPGSALDGEAERRGNSVYFPDRVVPMLPEALSNELCSLKPGEDRACVAADLWIDAGGRKSRHRFCRGLMRSAARLTYEAVQAAHDDPAGHPLPLPAERLAALYGAFAALERARVARGALELDLAEHRVVLDDDRRPVAITQRPRLASHRLIEEFMILANVAAAEELEARHLPCLYRVHDSPDPERLAGLGNFLAGLGVPGLALAKGQAPRPALFNRLLRRAATTPQAPLINDLVLRAQAQAVYSPHNIGHFGLALRRYAHFTSPIRRYADLVVHRALVDAAPAADTAALAAIGEHVSVTERRAAAAERAALDRYRIALLSDRVDAVFAGRISGVATFGLFVALPENGADGLVPISTLPRDDYVRDAAGHRLVGRHGGAVFTLGDAVTVRLAEVDAVAGRLVFRIIDEGGAPHLPASRRRGLPPRSIPHRRSSRPRR